MVGGSLSALEGHGRDELLHLVGQPLLPRLFVQLQGGCDLLQKRKKKLGSNTRRSKKHGASASVTGLDLVKQRLRI